MIASSGNEALNGIAWALWIASLLLPPIAIAIAILRYRLYDIDRIVSNAIGYGVVTVVLFAVFAGVNVVLVSQVSPLVNNEGIAVAASTLLVAALFNPLRTRVQRGVDRRFHRARYDADEMVQDFAARLRDELDLATLVDDLATIDHASRRTDVGRPVAAGARTRERPMTGRTAVATAVAIASLGVFVLIPIVAPDSDVAGELIFGAATASFVLVGLLLVVRAPGNRIGAVLLTAGALLAFAYGCDVYGSAGAAANPVWPGSASPRCSVERSSWSRSRSPWSASR